jgi:preprotein translocase subunit SecD
MKIRWHGFNTYLAVMLGLALLCGCQSTEGKRKKQTAVLRVHIEGDTRIPDSTQPVPIYRENPVMINIAKQSILNENLIKEAKVVEVAGSFAIQLQFDHKGTLLLEQLTGANKGKHLAIFATFGIETDTEKIQSRWLAAPMIQKHIADGRLTFTPDATREEADQIVIGLNNVAKKEQIKDPQW